MTRQTPHGSTSSNRSFRSSRTSNRRGPPTTTQRRVCGWMIGSCEIGERRSCRKRGRQMDSRAESCKFHKWGKCVQRFHVRVYKSCSVFSNRVSSDPVAFVAFTSTLYTFCEIRGDVLMRNGNRQKYRARNGDKNFEINSDELS